MTREERKEAIKVIKNYDLNNPKVNSLLFSAEEITNAFDCALEALEQESVLDKVKAEIKQLRLHKAQFITGDNKVCIDSQEVLNVINKYRTESEET